MLSLLWRGVNRMLKKLFRMIAGGDRDEAEAAQKDAQRSLDTTRARTAEIAQLAGRMQQHGVINHIGERVEAAWRGV